MRTWNILQPIFLNNLPKQSPQQFCTIVTFDILSTVIPIGYVKAWGE